jgi:SAM-dependent methyltransferase
MASMPDRDANRARWSDYDWSQGGDDWSFGWGSSRMLWFGSILPRIHVLLPARNLLEIAPGYGRVTAFLLEHCERYTGVDITPRCVEACQQRFAGAEHARFVLNDGNSLEAVADGSLVHADPGVLQAYVNALSRKLAPGGRAFLHHSNLGAFADPETKKVAFANPHWRDEQMTAALMRRFCAEAGLTLDAQELVQWGATVENDCFTWLSRPASGASPTVGPVFTHPSFGAEIAYCGQLFRGPGRGEA